MSTAVLSPTERDELRLARASDASPYDRVMSLDADRALIAMFVVGASVAQAALGAFFVFVSLIGLSMFGDDVRSHVGMRLAEVEIDIAREEPPKPAALPEVQQVPQEVTKETPKEAPPQAAAPAQVAQALTAKEDPNAPLDLTGNTIVSGSGADYAGGNSTNNGTSTVPVRTVPSASGVPGGTGNNVAPPPTGVDHSRSAGLLGGNEWNCSSFWPTEADIAQIDEAVVKVQVSVNAEGLPQTVKVLSDPGNGFGGAAIRCAKRQRFRTSLDREGNAQAGTTNPFNVRFNR